MNNENRPICEEVHLRYCILMLWIRVSNEIYIYVHTDWCDGWRIPLIIMFLIYIVLFCCLRLVQLMKMFHWSKRERWKAVNRKLERWQISDLPVIDLQEGNRICLQKNSKKNIPIEIITSSRRGNRFVDRSDKQYFICRLLSLMWSCQDRYTQMWQCWITSTRSSTSGRTHTLLLLFFFFSLSRFFR